MTLTTLAATNVDSDGRPFRVSSVYQMKLSRISVALALFCAASVPVWAARGHRGGFSPGSGFHRGVVVVQRPQHKPVKESKPAPHPKTAQKH